MSGFPYDRPIRRTTRSRSWLPVCPLRVDSAWTEPTRLARFGSVRASTSLAFSTLLALSTFAAIGRANGRFPRAQRLIEHPDDPAKLVLTGTYGMFVTRDRGITWHHVCESSFAHVPV